MINVEAAFVILSNATDPELASALQQNAGLRRRVQRILEVGPPRNNSGNAPLHQRQAQQRLLSNRCHHTGRMALVQQCRLHRQRPQHNSEAKAMRLIPAHALGRICQKLLTRKAPAPATGHSTILGTTPRSTPRTLGTSQPRRRSNPLLHRKAKASKAKLRKAKASLSMPIGRTQARHLQATRNGRSPTHRRQRRHLHRPLHCNQATLSKHRSAGGGTTPTIRTPNPELPILLK